MNEIILATGRDPALGKDALHGMFALRHQVFKERLAWEVESRDGLERDWYDDLAPTYMVACNDRRVEGCWRLLPTTGPYMLKDTFPQLLCGEPAPEDPAVWELSRFAVAGNGDGPQVQAALNPVTMAMIRSVVEYADRNGIARYVTVTSVALERLLTRIGIPFTRLGDRKAQRIGKVLTVAGRIEIDDRLRAAVSANCRAVQNWKVAA